MHPYIVRKEISILAGPAAVWDALTNPAKTKEYFFHCEVFSDWKVGSPITFKGKVLLVKPIEMKGTILAVEPNRFLQYNLVNDHDGDGRTTSTVTDQLHYEGGVTTLSITDDVGDGEGAEERYERSDKGWEQVLNGLKELVEKEQAL